MYQGKFSQNHKDRPAAPVTPERRPEREDSIEGLEDLEELLRDHEDTRQQPRPQQPQQSRPQQPQQPRPQQPRPQQSQQPRPQQSQQPRQERRQTRPEKPQQPRPQQPRPQQPADRRQQPQQAGARRPARPQQLPQEVREEPVKRRGPRTGSLIFYTIFFLGIFLFYVFVYFALGDLQDWLVKYEAAQPTLKCQQVFVEYFGDPDWGELYDSAGIESTAYEGRDQFVSYMEEQVGQTPLNYMETSAGLSGDKKYVVRLGDQKIATFTLEDHNKAVEITDIPDWQLGEIELFFNRSDKFLITLQEGHKALVNGVELDESHLVRKVANKAGEYLPEGVAGNQIFTLQIDGLMVQPTVTVTDAAGKEMPVTYDEATRTFTEELTGDTISPEEEKLVLDALKTYAEYMSGKANAGDIAKHFDRKSDAYKAITGSDLNWVQSDKGHEFSNESVTDYVRYADDLFSARGSVTLGLLRGDGSVKETKIEQSMFFRKTGDKWLCFAMTAVNVSEPVEQIRLVFTDGENILSDEFVAADASQIQCPVMSAPEGQVFSGWATDEKKDNGDIVRRLVFQPDENGVVNLAGGADLQPMELQPLFEAATPTA